MISVTARLISFDAAACPIASPSPKLCTPMPIAIMNASRTAGVERSNDPRLEYSSTAAAPGPTSGELRRPARFFIHAS